MKYLAAPLCVGVAMALAACSCSRSGAAHEVCGFPIYRFLNLGAIDAKFLEAHEAELRNTLGKGYEDYVTMHKALVSHGLDLHTPLTIQTDTGSEVEVFVRTTDYKSLWELDPHDLAKQNKSHLVSITYTQENVGSQTYNKAISFSARLVDGEPIMRK